MRRERPTSGENVMAKPVRMADIAQKLNISVVSVSKALAGKPGVSEEMRARVVALARQMGYEGVRPYAEAASTGNIGVLVADHLFGESSFYNDLYRRLVLAGGSEGFTSMLEIVSAQAEKTAQLPALIAGRKVDGLIFMGNLETPYLQAVAGSGLPCVLLDFHAPNMGLDCIVSDNVEGGCALTEHLLRQGCTEIGFAGSIRATTSIMDRYLGYQRALRTAGLLPREEWLLEDRDEDGNYISLTLPSPLPRAFVCNCDDVAYQMVETLRRAGVRVPQEVAVCGYDDFRFATLCRPQLTSYRVDVELMARTAVDRLVVRMRGEEAPPVCYTIPGRLVVRESSAAAAMD